MEVQILDSLSEKMKQPPEDVDYICIVASLKHYIR